MVQVRILKPLSRPARLRGAFGGDAFSRHRGRFVAEAVDADRDRDDPDNEDQREQELRHQPRTLVASAVNGPAPAR